MTDAPCLEAALAYARAGIAVFPVGVDKAPLTPNGFKDATTDEVQIRRWWSEHPEAGVAVPLGPGIGIALDVDSRHGGDVSLAKLTEEHGPLPPGPVARTGGGGAHHWFAWPGGNVPIAHGFRPGLDLQSGGSYVVLPPSTHASGRRYEWLVPLIGTKLPFPPAWLLKVASESRGRPGEGKFEATAEGKIPHGRHHDFIVSTAASLASRIAGISEADLLRSVRATVRETLDDADAHEPEVGEAVRSALVKYGRAATGTEHREAVEGRFDELVRYVVGGQLAEDIACSLSRQPLLVMSVTRPRRPKGEPQTPAAPRAADNTGGAADEFAERLGGEP